MQPLIFRVVLILGVILIFEVVIVLYIYNWGSLLKSSIFVAQKATPVKMKLNFARCLLAPSDVVELCRTSTGDIADIFWYTDITYNVTETSM